ncbi:uncharacterized protein LOC122405295 [Colletes gigas]|uniref:uncharacterized protein LOC122405295 n=1 Tax=Colletes gigas TaxID=935657 RepID=UPI001C9A6C81|nr:uncharacterized protein LOC122405295 [Colletes gigas]
MKHSLVIVFAVVLHGLWRLPCNDAVPADDLSTGIDTIVEGFGNNVKDIVSSLFNTTSSVTSELTVVVNNINNCLMTILESVKHVVQIVVHWVVSTVGSKIGSLFGLDGSMGFPSSLSSVFEGFLSNPINSVREWLSMSGTNALQIFVKYISVFVRWLEHFMVSSGLPWLHSVLDRIESSYNVPSTVPGLIESFNTFYRTL